jgi:hypothetical protein
MGKEDLLCRGELPERMVASEEAAVHFVKVHAS